MQRINPAWKEEKLEAMAAFKEEDGVHFEVTTSFNKAAQWLIIQLAAKDIPFKVLNLGAGVKKITTRTDTCPKCKGCGRV